MAVFSLFLLCACGRCGRAPEKAVVAFSGPAVDAGIRRADPLTFNEEVPRLPWAIGFVSEATKTAQLHVVDLADGGEHVLTEGPAAHFPATLAPDGGALAVIEAQGEGESHAEWLSALRPDGGTVALHPPTARVRNPSWSRDGKWLAVATSAEGFSEIYRIDSAGRRRQRLTQNREGNFEPDVSVDGRIVFTSSRDQEPNLFVIDADGKNERRIVATAGEDVSPRWSPDAGVIAFISSRTLEDQIYLVSPDGGDGTRVHDEPPAPRSTRMPEPKEKDIAWSPDGTRLVFSKRARGGQMHLWLADVEKRSSGPLTRGDFNEDSPAWSPDGKYIAFVSDRSGAPAVYVMRADGTGVMRVTLGSAPAWLPVWLPRTFLR